MALDNSKAKAAAKYNRALKLDKDLSEDIQRLVGASVDGDLGPASARAIAAWQASEGLSASGKLDATTLEEIEDELLAEARHAENDDDDDDDDDDGDDDWYVDLRAVKRTKSRGKPKRKRKWKVIDGITLHQTACVYSSPTHKRVINVPAHAMTFADGMVALLNAPNAYMSHAHRLNRRSIGIEVSAHACGVEGVFTASAKDRGANTFWRPKSRPDIAPVEATDAQLEATKRLVRYYIGVVAAHGGKIKYVFAHRQSAAKPADPGSRIWKAVGIWAQQEFGLTNGPKANYTIGGGSPIPTAWDPRVEGVPYSRKYKGY